MANQQFYSDEDAEQILRVAATKSSSLGAISRDQLVSTAAELGISVEAIEAAETQVLADKQARADQLAFDRKRRQGFLESIVIFLVIVPAMLIFNTMRNGWPTWSLYIGVFWTLRILKEGFETYARGSEDYQKDFKKWKSKRSLEA